LVRAGRVAEGAREYESALAVIEAVRSSLLDADSRIRYHDLKMKFFKDYVDLLVTEGQTEQALQVAEYSRGRVLAENLGVQSAAIGEVRTAALQRYAARTGQVLLSFWLAPHRSFVWVIHPDQILLRELPGEDEIGDLVSGYRQAIEVGLRDPLETGLPIAQRLSATLLTPIQDDIANADSIVIVLDGALHALNLDTLLVADGQQYWIEQAELSIAPSLSVLADRAASVAAENTSDERRTPSLLLIGAPEPPDPRYPALPEASTEIEAIRKHFEGAKAVVLTGSNATPSSFLDAAPEDFSMIHFAAHAEANPESPLESAVILSEDDDRYKLYAHDIAGLELSADLVTISACYAAGSRFYGGEGLVGFAWAFLQSGAHSVVAGLWDVGDAASSHLMDRLYEGIAAGMTPSEALREAKLSLLRSDGAYRKPFYWAPYQTYLR
jgi:CHAT domain-containing protein